MRDLGQRRASARAAVVLGAGLLVHAAGSLFWPRDDSGYHAILDTWLYDALLLGAAAVGVAGSLVRRSDRTPWFLVGIAVLLWAAGDVYWTVAIAKLDPAPFPTWADAAWLVFYPLVFLAVAQLVRHELPRIRAGMWLDGVIAGAGVAALATAAVVPTVLADAEGNLAAVLVNAAYPIGDVSLLALVIAVISVFGWRPLPHWWPLCGGLAVFAVADAAYLVRVAEGTYVEGTLLDTLWPLALCVLAAAAWAPGDAPAVPARTHSWAWIGLPAAFTGVALALLVSGQVMEVPFASVVLSAVTITAATVRAGFAFRDVMTLADTRRQARTDELTGLGNRRLLFEGLEAALAEPKAPTLALLLVDLDRFKEINDSLGHHVGDRILEAIGPRIAGATRDDDVLARLGGDEFALLLQGPIDEHLARKVADRVRSSIAQPFRLDGITLRVDASVGIALFPQHGVDAAALLQRADVAMYDAKKQRSGSALYVPARDGNSRDRLELIEQLRAAIARDELIPHFQPIVDVRSGAVVGMEALVRWEHPDHGLVPPDEFIPLAEQVGLIGDVTATVLAQSAAACRSWRDLGLDLFVAVNLSPSDLLDVRLADRVGGLLAAAGLDGRHLELEITENILMADPERALTTIEGLRAHRVGVAIDDFGTGYSSLAYLRQFAATRLKLDRSFVTTMDRDRHLEAIVASTVQLAHSLGLAFAAEGVETAEVLERLADLGADVAQGWHLGRPMAAHEALTWLHAHGTKAAPLAGRLAHR